MLNTMNAFFRKRPRFNLFNQFGFIENNGVYHYNCAFLNGDFRAEIEINKSGEVVAKVIDNMTDEEYLPIWSENRDGAFVNTVRSEFDKILNNIANNCFEDVPFMSNQGNRIMNLILQKYNVKPDFPWSGNAFKSFGTFRHDSNKKWFALIMNVKMSILDEKNEVCEMVDVINVKTESHNIELLWEKKGFYPAYHMSRKTWVSLILNETLSDESVMAMVDKSYELTLNKS